MESKHQFQNNFEKEYSENSFWNKVKNSAQSAGKELIGKALTLFYYAKDPEVPVKDKAIVFGALGYFILPFDAIPDALPGLGFTDDLGVIVAAYKAIAKNITEEHKQKAKEQMEKWFD